MRIEDQNYLVLKSGRKLYVDCGVVGLTGDGEITEGFSDQLLQHELTDHDKWELARFMINRWMDYRDQLWEIHENMLDEMTHMLDKDTIQERVEADTEKLHEAIMGAAPIDSLSDLGVDIVGPFKKVVDLGQLSLGFRVTENPAIKDSTMFMMSEGETHNCRCSVVPVPELLEEAVLPVWDGVIPVTEPEIVDGPICPDTTCFEHEPMHKDGCHLKTSERDKCPIWKKAVAAKKVVDAIASSPDPILKEKAGGYLVRPDTAEAIREELKKEESCPVPDCPFTIKGRCAYVFPRGCGIRLNYINRKDFEVPVPRECNHEDCGLLCGKKGLRYSDIGAREEMNKLSPCPECQHDTLIGMYKHSTNNWEVVEPRYCPICNWKENGVEKESKATGWGQD